jgi:hypothetical protein
MITRHDLFENRLTNKLIHQKLFVQSTRHVTAKTSKLELLFY